MTLGQEAQRMMHTTLCDPSHANVSKLIEMCSLLANLPDADRPSNDDLRRDFGYPYLALSRESGVDHGIILCYADWWQRVVLREGVPPGYSRSPPSYWEQRAIRAIGGNVESAREIQGLVQQFLRIQGKLPPASS